MTDSLSVAFAIINTLFASAGVVITLYGQHYFQQGLLARTLIRGTVVAVLLLAHFALDMLAGLGVMEPLPLVGHLLELGFTLGLAYLTYGMIRDWQTISVK